MKKICVLFLSIVMMLMLGACASAEDLATEAEQAFNEGKWQTAMEKSNELLEKAETEDQTILAKGIIKQSEIEIKWGNLAEYVRANHDTIEFNDHIDVAVYGKTIHVELDNINKEEAGVNSIYYSDFTTMDYNYGDEKAVITTRRYEALQGGSQWIYRLEDEVTGHVDVGSYQRAGNFIVDGYSGDDMILFEKGEKACAKLGQQRFNELLSALESSCLAPVSMTLDTIGFTAY